MKHSIKFKFKLSFFEAGITKTPLNYCFLLNYYETLYETCLKGLFLCVYSSSYFERGEWDK